MATTAIEKDILVRASLLPAGPGGTGARADAWPSPEVRLCSSPRSPVEGGVNREPHQPAPAGARRKCPWSPEPATEGSPVTCSRWWQLASVSCGFAGLYSPVRNPLNHLVHRVQRLLTCFRNGVTLGGCPRQSFKRWNSQRRQLTLQMWKYFRDIL